MELRGSEQCIACRHLRRRRIPVPIDPSEHARNPAAIGAQRRWISWLRDQASIEFPRKHDVWDTEPWTLPWCWHFTYEEGDGHPAGGSGRRRFAICEHVNPEGHDCASFRDTSSRSDEAAIAPMPEDRPRLRGSLIRGRTE
jgi:hypothetical protein